MLLDAIAKHLPSAVDLARAQFAFTVVFHLLFPAFTIGLASYLAVLEGLWLRTHKAVYLDTYRYWLKIFAVAFAMGVVHLFLLFDALVLIPIVLLYTGYVYWLFRGKVTADVGYH